MLLPCQVNVAAVAANLGGRAIERERERDYQSPLMRSCKSKCCDYSTVPAWAGSQRGTHVAAAAVAREQHAHKLIEN